MVVAGLLALAATALVGVRATAVSPGRTADPLADELASAARAVSDPHSPMYRQFETPAQVAKYLDDGASPNARAAMPQPDGVATGVLMRSQLVTADEAFGEAGAAGDPPGPPRPCSSYFGQLAASGYPPPPSGAGTGGRLPFAVCGYTPEQLRSAYDTDEATGSGVTVAVLDAYGSSTIEADANTYATRHGDSAFAPGQYTQIVTPNAWTLQDVCGGAQSWAAEQTLDVEAVHALAPRAHLLYYGADSCQDSDLLAAFTDIVAHRRADVVTASWGGPIRTVGGTMSAAVIARYDRLFQVAALEGMTVDFSSGDCGVNAPTTACGGPDAMGSTEPQTSYPASDPWVTAVGGTTVQISDDGELCRQTAWGTDGWRLSADGSRWQPLGWIYGGGGGASADFAEPWYQVGHVPAALAATLPTGAPAATARRTVPDVALDADPFTGMLVGQTRMVVASRSESGYTGVYAEAAVGGTSLASPLMAGLEADAIETGGGRPLGFVNPALYARAHSSLFDDVGARDHDKQSMRPQYQVYPPHSGKTAGLAGIGDDGPLAAAPGYDTATGLGSPAEDFAERLTS